MLIELDGKPMFTVAKGDARELAGESIDDLAQKASRQLQKAWTESRESRDPKATLNAVVNVAIAAFALMAALFVTVRMLGLLRERITRRLSAKMAGFATESLGARIGATFLGVASRTCVLAAWFVVMFLVFVFITFSLRQFPQTRAAGEELTISLSGLVGQVLHSVAGALPGVFVATLIFLATWVVTQVTAELFRHVTAGNMRLGILDAHSAPATRRITNTLLWLFALAMAYPYLPGAQTEAFKGLSVILGLMVSIGASGLIGQIASGVMLVYTRALMLGEYVRIQDCEGTVTELGLFVTRLRTGMGEEVSMPNSFVLANVTRNFSRLTPGGGFILDTTVTIGYDTPWRQVHAMLLEAVKPVTRIAADPAPYVVQTALSDFYVAYKLVAYVSAEKPEARAKVISDLNASIQDVFNRYGVQIMSPHYYIDPEKPKVVPESDWHAAPAVANAASASRS
jgi:small-conductance mechanosensitive channel